LIHGLRPLPVFVREIFQEVFDEQRNILLSFSEWGNDQRNNVELEEKLFSELSLGDEFP